MKNVSNGVDLERRIFIFSKTSGGNVKKKERVRLEEHNVNVLQKFIKSLTDELIDRR